jgi:natural product biosynthesis luciferase-like monooxygenase protein
MDFSLFYFADDADAATGDDTDDNAGAGHHDNGRYRLLIEGARFADTHGFQAVWTPERHFDAFGGLYPNPAVTAAAVAAVTEHVEVRAGSVVAPLHHPVRIAEEWSVVDNLSGGRVGIAFASGWHSADFALRPENYGRRREVLVETVETVRRLWRGEAVALTGGGGEDVSVRTFPPPVRPELPIWLTSSGTADTFRTAGELGAGVLTHLLGQDLDDLAKKITIYREAYAEARPDAARAGHVVLMLHAFLGTDRDEVRETVRAPFSAYLRSSIGLIARAATGGLPPGLNIDKLAPADVDFLVARSFDRYFDSSGLFGTVEDGLRLVESLRAVGVDEVACLIDFGVAADRVLDSLTHLDRLRAEAAGGR